MDNENNSKTPAEIEKSKTKKQRAEDVAYTMNHALVCTGIDVIAGTPYIGNKIQQKFGNKSQLHKWYAAELIGDFGAIPVTVGMQRLFPGLMTQISETVEPIFKKSFQKGARRAAKEWAERHGVSEDSAEYKERFDKIYKYEVSHVPQALTWAVSSTVLNVVMQLAIDKEKTPIRHILAGKIGGAVFAAAITLGARTIFPHKAEKLDRFISKKFILPAEEVEEKLEKMLGHHDEDNHKNGRDKKDDSWKERIKIGSTATTSEIRI